MAVAVSILFPYICCITVLLGVVLLIRRRQWNKRSQGFPIPPGPRGWPIIGNLLELPIEGQPWIVYREWSKRYGMSSEVSYAGAYLLIKCGYTGDVMFLDLPSMPTVVISSTDIALDLFEKRSAIYSDRPRSAMDEL